MPEIDTSLIYVTIIGAFLAFSLGTIWYHPRVLGTKWKAARKSDTACLNAAPLPFLVSFLLWVLSSAFFSFLAAFHGVDTPAAYLCLASLLWVAFAMPPIIMGALYTGYPFQAVAIDSSYQLAGYYILALAHVAAQWLQA